MKSAKLRKEVSTCWWHGFGSSFWETFPATTLLLTSGTWDSETLGCTALCSPPCDYCLQLVLCRQAGHALAYDCTVCMPSALKSEVLS